jgi:hypothetical protein
VSFRYYLYISDSKIDMLLGQIDPALMRKRVSELSVDLKVFGARRGVESPAGAERIARLERVARHLQDHGDLGSVDEPGQFFWGLLPMQWGHTIRTRLVYFGGQTDRTILALGGSIQHVVGASPAGAGPLSLPASLLPSLLAELAPDTTVPAGPLGGGYDPDVAAFRQVQSAHQRLRGPVENVEFIAKRLLHGPNPDGDGRSILLGSPLYIALAD